MAAGAKRGRAKTLPRLGQSWVVAVSDHAVVDGGVLGSRLDVVGLERRSIGGVGTVVVGLVGGDGGLHGLELDLAGLLVGVVLDATHGEEHDRGEDAEDDDDDEELDEREALLDEVLLGPVLALLQVLEHCGVPPEVT
jgi:hypothetical protein